MKLRVNYACASASRIKKLPSQLPGDNTATSNHAENVAKSRRPCELMGSRPPIPSAGNRGASHIGEIVEMDLFLVGDGAAILCDDVATRFTYISKIVKEEAGDS